MGANGTMILVSGEYEDKAMIDRALSFEHRTGSKWVRVVWASDADEPEVRWRLEQNGSPAPSLEIDVRAGARRVQVTWEAGKYEAKVRFWDYEAQEGHAQAPVGNVWYRDSDSGWSIPESGEK